MKTMRCLSGCILLLAGAATALAGTRNVPDDYSTIQAAVNAAASGDVVVCKSGTYTEAVTATKSNITIKGYGATWAGGTGSAAKNCLDVTGDAVVVAGFTFKEGLDHVRLKGNDCSVVDVKSLDAGGSFCVIEGARAKVDTCAVERAKAVGAHLKGNAATCVSTTFKDCEDVACRFEGDDGNLKKCRADRCKKGAFHCKGKRTYCYSNEAYSCAEFGLHLEGDAAVAVTNYVEECGSAGGAGYLVTGNDCTLKYCDSWACKPHGHHIKGHRNWCYDNWSHYDEDCGFRFEGDDNECDDSLVRYCGGDGHRIGGDRNEMYDCDARYCEDDGFDVETGVDNSLRYCTSKYNGGAGCENGGSSTDLYGCVLLYNSVDIGLSGAAGASFGTLSLNVFGSGSITGILGIGLGL